MALSKDGKLAFSSMGRIWIKEKNTESIKRLTSNYRPREFMPSWSPDGDWVCFVTWDEMGGHLWVMRSDGTEEPKKSPKSRHYGLIQCGLLADHPL